MTSQSQVVVDNLLVFQYNDSIANKTLQRKEWYKMDENRKPEGKREDFRRAGNANRALTFRLLGVGVVLYWLYELVIGYVRGGPDAPSTGLLILAVVVMGGGAGLVAWLAFKLYKQDKAAAEMTEEEIEEVEALRQEDEAGQEALPAADEKDDAE